MDTYDIVTFQVGEQRYALPIKQVVEVLRMVAIRPLPDAPAGMLGVINFRGTILPLIDLPATLGLSATPIKTQTPILVAKHENRLMGLVVATVYDVQTVSLKDETTAQSISAELRYVKQVVRAEEGLIFILSLESIASRFPHVGHNDYQELATS